MSSPLQDDPGPSCQNTLSRSYHLTIVGVLDKKQIHTEASNMVKGVRVSSIVFVTRPPAPKKCRPAAPFPAWPF